MRALVLALVLVAGAAPAAGEVAVSTPVHATGTPLVPQLTCALVFHEPGIARCDAHGPVSAVHAIRIETRGAIGLHVLVGDEARERQVESFDCPPTCERVISQLTTPHASLTVFVTATGPGASTASLSS